MAFPESLKLRVKKRADFCCCRCHEIGVEVHHIIPQEEGGPDTEENAAPLCPSCHDLLGDNAKKRKQIRELRDHWYEVCEKKYFSEIQLEQTFVTKLEFKNLKKNIENLQLKMDFPYYNKKLNEEINASDSLSNVKLLIKNKKYEDAEKILINLIVDAQYLLGYVYGEKEDIENMIISFNKATELDNKYKNKIEQSLEYFWAVNFNLGVQYFSAAIKTADKEKANSLYNNSINSFEKASKCKTRSVETYSNIIYAYFNMNKIDEAIPVLEKAITLGSSPDIVGMLGQIYNEKAATLMESYESTKNVEDKTKAMELYNKSIKVLEEGKSKFSEDGDILLRLSNAYIGANKLDVAMDAFKSGVEKEPDNKYYRYNYGVILLNSKDYTGAEEQFKKAVELDSSYTNAIYNLAVTYVRWGAKMRKDLETTGEFDDSYKEKFKLAVPYLEQYLATYTNEPQIWELLGRVYGNLGMMEKSNEAFKKAEHSNINNIS